MIAKGVLVTAGLSVAGVRGLIIPSALDPKQAERTRARGQGRSSGKALHLAPWLYACFIRGLSPGVALQRIGVAPGPLGESGFGVAAYRGGGGAVLIECGWAGIIHDRADLLSVGTVAASVFATTDNDGFTYRVDGDLITTFDLYSYPGRSGSDPDRLQADVEALGMDVDGELPESPSEPYRGAVRPLERLPYGEQSVGEVDVLPAEPEEFTAPQAKRQRADPEGFEPIIFDHGEQPLGLLDREHFGLLPA
ncbi:DUF6461 domain-containing protein [Streptosporangium canum]|uniref:DUF6461 domain-containing protein n=1 Tax=Streptosporangium canum TaxID=324952 RepID=UPI003F4D2949